MTDIKEGTIYNSRILLIDSDKTVRQAMRYFFANTTRMFTSIGSAEEAQPMLEGPLWDIVVCNLKLPGMNGLQFCNLARQLKPKTQLILVTKYRHASLKRKAAEIGITDIITAPVTPEKLVSYLARVSAKSEENFAVSSRQIASNPDITETVSVLELDESMIIQAFIRFNEQFQNVSTDKCAWIQHNFKGARALVERNGKRFDLVIQGIKPGDTIIKLHQLPVSLMKLTFVRQPLIKELKKRGFLAFEVKRKPTRKSISQQIRLGAIHRTEAFLGKVSETIGTRKRVCQSIQSIFSHRDSYSIDIYDLVSHIDFLTESETVEAICAIAALEKGDQLFAHSVDVGAIFLSAYSHWVDSGGIKNTFTNTAEMMLSAMLHDIGKIFIPLEIRESTLRFDDQSPQMKQMREHPTYSASLLSRMGLSQVAINMALFHHVKMDPSITTSYPPVESYDAVLPETRLLSIVDTFQGLVGNRPYKQSWSSAAAMKYIHNLEAIEFDPAAWLAFRDAMGWYPVGSLVELNDGSKAFVVERAYHGLHRPSVVVARNAADEELTHNTFFDLNTEKDIFIRKGLDQFSIFGDKVIDRFIQLQVS